MSDAYKKLGFLRDAVSKFVCLILYTFTTVMEEDLKGIGGDVRQFQSGFVV